LQTSRWNIFTHAHCFPFLYVLLININITLVSPFDMIRTRLMNQPADQKIYKNAVDCAYKIATQEGPLTFWRGFMPIWSRFAPTTTLQLVIFEQLRSLMGMKAL
jgi:hypothetical protein